MKKTIKSAQPAKTEKKGPAAKSELKGVDCGAFAQQIGRDYANVTKENGVKPRRLSGMVTYGDVGDFGDFEKKK